MTFWTLTDVQTEPAFSNKWYIEFGDPKIGDNYTFLVKQIKKPSLEISNTENLLLTHTFNMPSLLSWKAVELTLMSSLNSQSNFSNIINSYLEKTGYVPPQYGHQALQRDSDILNEKDFLSNNKLIIYQINSLGNEICRWILNNPLITSVNYGNLSYESEGFVEITVNIEYDWADIKQGRHV